MERYVQTGINQVAGKVFNTPSGPIYIGNENGSLNQIISGISDYAAIFGVNIPRGLTTVVRPDTQSSESKSLTIKNGSSAEVDGVWQFLFNPSELELVAGPEYNKSETWGVMDNANAGAPKSFQAIRNPELKFSGVKLNGYVFGKKVEDLEQGLFELFMTPGGGDNGTSNGPQVLEFVWGKRTFGPCIIKDVRVTEKMWDDGLLVSADVNFTLEKVPEWTINDGQVSVYTPFEPGTQPTQVNPEEKAEELPDEEEKTEPPEQKEEDTFGTFQQCKNIQSDIDVAFQLSRTISSNSYDQGSNFYGGAGAFSFSPGGYNPTFPANLNTYNSALSKYKSNSFYSPYINSSLAPKCSKPNFYIKTNGYDNSYRVIGGEDNATDAHKKEIDKKYNAQLVECANQLSRLDGPLEAAYRNLKCNNYHTDPSNPTERI
jgi:hypothetical protein